MRTHKISILGGILGASIILLSIIRWFFMWYDPSQAILGASIGLIICIFSYLYNWMKGNEEEFEKMNKRLDAFTNWWTRQEMEEEK